MKNINVINVIFKETKSELNEFLAILILSNGATIKVEGNDFETITREATTKNKLINGLTTEEFLNSINYESNAIFLKNKSNEFKIIFGEQ